jgi:hypothetical protein
MTAIFMIAFSDVILPRLPVAALLRRLVQPEHSVERQIIVDLERAAKISGQPTEIMVGR